MPKIYFGRKKHNNKQHGNETKQTNQLEAIQLSGLAKRPCFSF